MNRVPVIVRNPAYIEEVELDEDEVDPADISPQSRNNLKNWQGSTQTEIYFQ